MVTSRPYTNPWRKILNRPILDSIYISSPSYSWNTLWVSTIACLHICVCVCLCMYVLHVCVYVCVWTAKCFTVWNRVLDMHQSFQELKCTQRRRIGARLGCTQPFQKLYTSRFRWNPFRLSCLPFGRSYQHESEGKNTVRKKLVLCLPISFKVCTNFLFYQFTFLLQNKNKKKKQYLIIKVHSLFFFVQ